MVSRLQDAHKEFRSIKNELRRYQCDYYDSKVRTINIPEGKTVYIRKDHVTPGLAHCFTSHFDRPYKLGGYYYGRKDSLKIQDHSGNVMKPVYLEKVVIAEQPYPLHLADENFLENKAAEEPIAAQNKHKELKLVAYRFANYLLKKTGNRAFASEACKYVYTSYPFSGRFELLRQAERTCFAMPIPMLEGAIQVGSYTIRYQDKPPPPRT